MLGWGGDGAGGFGQPSVVELSAMNVRTTKRLAELNCSGYVRLNVQRVFGNPIITVRNLSGKPLTAIASPSVMGLKTVVSDGTFTMVQD